ncbi:MAG: polysaccharide pyruvyl transferase CsaB [Janthinobacterium lividum]
MKRLLLSGYYGYGNAGDEAVLAGLLTGFRASASAADLELTVLSGNPSETRTAHGVDAVDRYRPSALLPAIAHCDLFLSGGGSLLQDVTSAHGIFYYLGVVRLAQMLGKKTMFIAQGIGPLKLARSRKLVASVANKLSAITVRDPDSAQLLREIGVIRPPIEVTADPALLLSPSPIPSNSPRIGGRGASSFGVALRPWHGQEEIGAQVTDACFSSLGTQKPLLIPMQPASDTPVAEQFRQKWALLSGQANAATLCTATDGLGPLLSIIAGCDMMVGMRLHALILAAAAGVPSVALSYDPKVTAFMQSSGQGDAVYDLNAPLDTLTSLLARVWAERLARAAALDAALPGLRAQATRNIEIALKQLSL